MPRLTGRRVAASLAVVFAALAAVSLAADAGDANACSGVVSKVQSEAAAGDRPGVASGGGTKFRTSGQAVVRLLNSRSAGNPAGYEAAAQIIGRDAMQLDAEGRPLHPLQRYVLAVVSSDRDAPMAARMSPELRKEYLDSSRERILQLAERKNNPLAWYLLSLEKNDLTYLRRAVDGNNVQALNAWGTIHLLETLADTSMPTNESERAMAECYGCFCRAAEQGDVNGVYNIGMCRMNGYGCERNENLAFESFRRAAEAGHPEAINNLGGFYRDGIIVRKDLKAAAEHFARSAELDNPYGMFNYALALQRGEGVEKDETRAAALLRRAAEAGNAEAMNAYGMCYFNGTGVEADPAVAFAWYRRSAGTGYPPAMDNLSVCYERGLGVVKSHKMATIWKVRSRANAGDVNAAAWLRQNGYGLRGGEGDEDSDGR